MKVIEDQAGFLRLEHADFRKGAQEDFNEGRFIEAFSIVQAYIEFLMLNLWRIKQLEKKKLNPEEIFDEFPYFQDLIKMMNKESLLSVTEIGRIKIFYHMRNRVVHRLLI